MRCLNTNPTFHTAQTGAPTCWRMGGTPMQTGAFRFHTRNFARAAFRALNTTLRALKTKAACCALLTLLTTSAFYAHADEKKINLQLHEATLQDLSELIFKGLLVSDYEISPDLMLDNRKFSLSINDKTPDEALSIVTNTLKKYGLYIVDNDGIKTLSREQTNETHSTNQAHEIKGIDNQPIAVKTNETELLTHYRAKYRNLDDVQKFIQPLGVKAINDGDMLFISADAQKIKAVMQLLKHYDRPIDDVIIKASLIEFTDTDNSGFNIFAFINKNKWNITAGSNLVMRDVIKFTASSFNFVLSQIREDSRFNIINTSTQRVVTGKPSRISIGSDVPILSQFSQTQTGQPIQNIEYRSSGLILDITPKLTNNFVSAELTQELSSFNETTTSNINSPTLTKRQLKTSLNAQLNEIIVIGGLDSSQSNDVKSSFLGLPVGSAVKTNHSTLYLLIEFSKV